MTNLTEKQRLFCDYLLLDKDRVGGTAYLKAYPAVTKRATADAAASRMLKLVKVTAYLAKADLERSERTNIDADWMLRELAEIHNMRVDDVLNDNGSVKAVKEWPVIWKKMVQAFDIQEMDSEQALIIIKKIKMPDKQKNLEMIGKHVDVQAFLEKTEVTVTDLHKQLAAGRQRAIEAAKGA